MTDLATQRREAIEFVRDSVRTTIERDRDAIRQCQKWIASSELSIRLQRQSLAAEEARIERFQARIDRLQGVDPNAETLREYFAAMRGPAHD